MQIEISDQEGAVLSEVLTSVLGDLRAEIYKTDSRTFKANLKEREAVLHALLERLPGRTDR
jgi:hypothetical protein